MLSEKEAMFKLLYLGSKNSYQNEPKCNLKLKIDTSIYH